MKKIFICTLILCCVLSIVGCSEQSSSYKIPTQHIWDHTQQHESATDSVYFSVTIPELDNATVEYYKNPSHGIISINGEHYPELGGFGCSSFYLADITGDGKYEMCFGISTSSGIPYSHIAVYDHQTTEIIFVSPKDDTLFMSEKDNVIQVEQKSWTLTEVLRTGELLYDGSKIYINWLD